MHPVAILYPGDMGHNVGRVLLEDGCTVVTTLVGRSERTRRLTTDAAITMLPSMEAVVAEAAIVLSIIPPTAAKSVAADFVTAVRETGHRPLFVDANAISPMTAQEVGDMIASSGAPYLDACIIGPASNVRGRCTFYISGSEAATFETQLGKSLRTHILGDRIGQASAFKMTFSGLNKGLAALLYELTAAGAEFGFLDELLHRYKALLPGVMEALEWLVPSYPMHAARRADEMAELAETLEHFGFSSVMARGTQDTLAAVGRLRLTERFPTRGEHGWTMREVLDTLAQEAALKKPQSS
ncbi:MAG: NAD(P)-dependent oxidoreductase [Deltaproteobacteria bacterium]|nr:NAD(P)-dependent oxidoreductase [Deltaproteobacteria bacterium]